MVSNFRRRWREEDAWSRSFSLRVVPACQLVCQAMKAGAVERVLARSSEQWLQRSQRKEVRDRLATLTPREFEVLKCVIAGRLNKQIASQLGTTEGTIKVHRGRVMEKMGATSVAELVILAQRGEIAPASPDATKV